MGNDVSKTWMRGIALAAILCATTAGTAFADDIRVEVKRGVLIITGERDGFNHVDIRPTATGLIVEGDVPGDDTINGGNRVFETDEPIRDWQFRFARSENADIHVLAPAEGIPPLRPRNVTFVSGNGGLFRATGLEIRGKLTVDMRRARDGARLTLTDTTVGRSIGFRSGTARTKVDITDCTIGRAAKLFARNFGPPIGQEGRVDVTLTNSVFGSLALGVALRSPGFLAPIVSEGNTFEGKVSLKGDVNVSSTGDSVGAKLTVDTGRGPRDIGFTDLTVTGKTTVRAGASGDVVGFTDSRLGKLTVLGGKRDDQLSTLRTTVGEGSRYSGGKGAADRWITSGDGTELTTRSVETIETNAQ